MKRTQSKAPRSEVAPKNKSQQATSRNETIGSDLIEFQMPAEEQTTWDADTPDAAGHIVKMVLASDEERISVEMYRRGLNKAESDLRRMAKSMRR